MTSGRNRFSGCPRSGVEIEHVVQQVDARSAGAKRDRRPDRRISRAGCPTSGVPETSGTRSTGFLDPLMRPQRPQEKSRLRSRAVDVVNRVPSRAVAGVEASWASPRREAKWSTKTAPLDRSRRRSERSCSLLVNNEDQQSVRGVCLSGFWQARPRNAVSGGRWSDASRRVLAPVVEWVCPPLSLVLKGRRTTHSIRRSCRIAATANRAGRKTQTQPPSWRFA